MAAAYYKKSISEYPDTLPPKTPVTTGAVIQKRKKLQNVLFLPEE